MIFQFVKILDLKVTMIGSLDSSAGGLLVLVGGARRGLPARTPPHGPSLPHSPVGGPALLATCATRRTGQDTPQRLDRQENSGKMNEAEVDRQINQVGRAHALD